MQIKSIEALHRKKAAGLARFYPPTPKILVGMATCGLAAGAQRIFDLLEPVVGRGNLRGKRRAFTRTLKTTGATGRPCQGITLTVGNRDDGVIERCMNMSDTFRHVLFNFFAHFRAWLNHYLIL